MADSTAGADMNRRYFLGTVLGVSSLGVEGIAVRSAVSLVDLMPTVLDFAGVPADDIVPIDGRSVLPLLQGEDADRVAFSELHSEGVNMACFMVRQGPYKYIYVTGHEPQLYNVEEDPGEWNNLAGQPQLAGIRRHMHECILALPGVGPKVVLPLMVKLFQWQTLTSGEGNAKGLTAFVGLDPQPYESGGCPLGAVRKQPGISKMGDNEMHRLLYMGALGGVRGE